MVALKAQYLVAREEMPPFRFEAGGGTLGRSPHGRGERSDNLGALHRRRSKIERALRPVRLAWIPPAGRADVALIVLKERFNRVVPVAYYESIAAVVLRWQLEIQMDHAPERINYQGCVAAVQQGRFSTARAGRKKAAAGILQGLNSGPL